MKAVRTPWTVLVAAVVIGALAQAATAIPGYAGVDSTAFLLAGVGSAAALILQTIALAWSASALGARIPLGSPRWSLLAWGVLVALILLMVATIAPFALPVAWTVALIVLPAAALGRWNPLAGLRPFRGHPWRASVAVLVMLLAGVLGVVVAALTGLFLTGFLGGLVAWLWFGAAAGALLAWWARLLAHAAPTVEGQHAG